MGSIIMLPDNYDEADFQYLIELVNDVLVTVVSMNDAISNQLKTVTRFHSQIPPNISISDYLKRIVKYASLEPVCLLMALIYADRVAERGSGFILCSLTVHRFLIAAITVATKAFCDAYCTNTHYAKVGGVSARELELLELSIIDALGWDLMTTQDKLQNYYLTLVENNPKFGLKSNSRKHNLEEYTNECPESNTHLLTENLNKRAYIDDTHG